MPDNSGSGRPSLGEMLAANTAAATAASAAAVSTAVPANPVIPTTATEAATRLAEIKADPKWRTEYLGGSVRHAKEMRDLQAVVNADKSRDPQAEMAVNGILYDGIQPSGHLAKVGTAEMLRAVGADDAVVRQVLAGEPVSASEHAAASAARARLMKDHDFTAKYLAGDGESRRALTMLNIVISSPIKAVA